MIVTTGTVAGPRSGGELRSRYLADALADSGHGIYLLGYVARNYPALLEEIKPGLQVEQRHTLLLDVPLMLNRMHLIPMTELAGWFKHLGKDIIRLCSRHKIDIVQFDFPWFVNIYPAIRDQVRIIYNAQNIESRYWEQDLADRMLSGLWKKRLLKNERRAIEGAHAVCACSPEDAEWMSRQCDVDAEHFHIAPNGFDEKRFHLSDPQGRRRTRTSLGIKKDEKAVVFTGSDTPPNIEAALFILTTIAPAIKDPAVIFYIIGNVSRSLEGSVEIPPNVIIKGKVEEVLPWLQASDIGLNPVMSGSGSNVKLAEYAAAGLAIITTEFGTRGYSGLKPHLQVASVGEFARIIGETRWPNNIPIGALKAYSWKTSAMRLGEVYRSCIDS
jgi:glycosyltransferase involved in cell wall biosynthesis